jgi:hypothetical protein
MVISYSKHAQPFIGSMHYRNISEESVRQSINKVRKFPKEKFYLLDREFNHVIVGKVIKNKVKIITVMTDLNRPITLSINSKFLEVS